MANFSVDGISDFQIDMEDLANTPDSVLSEMAEAGAKVVVNRIKSRGEGLGVHLTGVTLSSIKSKKPVIGSGGVSVTITPTGKNKNGSRNAEVAFVNNYGKKGQQARPFFTEGIAEAEDESIKAAQEVYENYLKSKKL